MNDLMPIKSCDILTIKGTSVYALFIFLFNPNIDRPKNQNEWDHKFAIDCNQKPNDRNDYLFGEIQLNIITLLKSLPLILSLTCLVNQNGRQRVTFLTWGLFWWIFIQLYTCNNIARIVWIRNYFEMRT